MANTDRTRKVGKTDSHRDKAPEQLRRIARAIIGLAQAQLEAEAEAAHASARVPVQPKKVAPATKAIRPRSRQ